MSQFFGILFFLYTQRVSTIGAPLVFSYKWKWYFWFTKPIRVGIDNINVTEKQNTMTEEEYFNRLIDERERYVDEYFEALEDRYEGDEWDFDGFYHY